MERRMRCCFNCKYWLAENDGTKLGDQIIGTCKRFPPTPMPERVSNSCQILPQMPGGDWCGEFVPRFPDEAATSPNPGAEGHPGSLQHLFWNSRLDVSTYKVGDFKREFVELTPALQSLIDRARAWAKHPYHPCANTLLDAAAVFAHTHPALQEWDAARREKARD